MDFKLMELEDGTFAFHHAVEEKVVAEITWTVLGDVMAVDSTFVSPDLRGQGVAKKLLDRAAQYARENEYKIEPICSYVVTAFERYDEYNDIKV